MARVRGWRTLAGGILGTHEAWLIHRGLETLEVRFARMCASAQAVAELAAGHPAVRAAAVVAKPHPKWGETPCAFVTLKDGAEVTEAEIIAAAEASRQEHPAPPDGPKALDRAMQRAAQRKVEDTGRKRRKPKAVPAPATKPITDLPAFYADLVNSDRYLPVSAISNTMRDAMLARGLVTAERLRERGVR